MESKSDYTFGFSCCARKAQASRFGTKTQLAGRTLTPIPPAGGGLTGELRHKPETHVGAAVCSAAWGALCRCVRFYGPTAHPCRSALHKRRVRPPWRREENRMKNFDWVILFGHSQANFDSQNGRKETKMNQKQYHSLEELPLMMNMTDVAAVLGISRAGAYKLAHSADFPAFQIGKRIVVSREIFLEWLDRQCEEQKCA